MSLHNLLNLAIRFDWGKMKINGQFYAVLVQQGAYEFRGTVFSAAADVYPFAGSESECRGERDRLIAEQYGLRQRVPSNGVPDAQVARQLAIRYYVVPARVVRR